MTLAEELRTVPIFADMPAEGLEWLASEMKLLEYSAGDLFVHEGERAEHMFVLLQGAIRTQPSSNGKPSWVVRAPGVAGLLPFSRMTGYPSTMRSVGVTRVAALPAGRFPEMLTRMPALQPRLISMMADRVRLATQLQDQTEKMAALGKLSAGLAHELNNPAAAARRAAANLRDAFGVFRQAVARLAAHALSAGQAAAIPDLEQELAHSAAATRQMDSLERSDCEEAVAARLEQHGVDRAWELAAVLVDAGCDAAWLDGVVARFPPSALPDLLGRLSASLTIGSLLNEIENSTSRISELVRAVKEYTHMDQGPEQEIDVHDGLEGTLLILRHRLKHGITVKLDFDRSLPKVCAQGSALNQVWTNLIDNAIDAMQEKGELRIRTARDLDRMLVEIGDNGPGVPQGIRDRIFEPFFTTKGVGQGTGLGLDTAVRIVREHRGEITVESAPGDTRFQIRLPFAGHSRD